MVIRLLLAFVLLAFGSGAQATQYFNWGAEGLSGANVPRCAGNTVNCWTTNFLNGNTAINCTAPHGGSCSMRATVNMVGTNEPAGLDIPDMSGEPPAQSSILGSTRYYRWWMKFDVGFSWGDNSGGGWVKMGRVSTPGQTWAYYTGFMAASRFIIQECNYRSGGNYAGDCHTTAGSPSLLTAISIPYNLAGKADGQWHEYISRVKVNTSATCTPAVDCDAEWEMYVDGVSVGSYGPFKLIGNAVITPTTFIDQWGAWGTNPYFQGASSTSAGGNVWFDDFSTDDVYNSLLGGDTTPPTAPTNLWLTIAGATQLDLSWEASTDAVGVTGYRIERCTNAACSSFVEIAQTSGTGTTYSNTSGITAGTFYGYRVRAQDAANNLSNYSNSAYAPPSALTHTATTTWSGLVNAVIAGHSFTTTTGRCLVMQNANQANIIVRNSTFNNCFDDAVLVTQGHDITFEDNTFSNSPRWLYIQSTTGNVIVQRNSMSNQNQVVNGTKGGIQFNGVSGAGNLISYNDITNTNPEGTEDNISVYNSDGVSGSPITVEKNCITGVTTNDSGSGIALGDGGGSYQLAQDNFVKDGGAGGIGIASGTNISALRNYIWQTGRPSVNGGLVIKNFYQGTETCDTIYADANRVDYRNSSGVKVDGITGTIWWPVDGCTNVTVTGTNSGMATLSGDVCAVVRSGAIRLIAPPDFHRTQ